MKESKKDKKKKKKKKNQPSNVISGLYSGTTIMISSIFQGVAGLVVEPIKGAKSNGVKGASLGVGKGILGLIWKPIAGSIDFVTQTARGIGNTPGTIYVGAKKIFKRKMKGIKIFYEYPAIRPYIPDENIEEEKDIYIGEDEEGEIYLNKLQLKLILQQHGIIDQESIDLISDKNELNINQQLIRQRDKLMKRQKEMKDTDEINKEFELLQLNLNNSIKQKDNQDNEEENKCIQPKSSYWNEFENIGKLFKFYWLKLLVSLAIKILEYY